MSAHAVHSVPAAARATAESDFYGPPRYSHRVHGRHTRVCWCGLSCSRTGCSPAPSAVVGGAIAGVAVDLRRCRRPEGKAGESQERENGRVRPSRAVGGLHHFLFTACFFRGRRGGVWITSKGACRYRQDVCRHVSKLNLHCNTYALGRWSGSLGQIAISTRFGYQDRHLDFGHPLVALPALD